MTRKINEIAEIQRFHKLLLFNVFFWVVQDENSPHAGVNAKQS